MRISSWLRLILAIAILAACAWNGIVDGINAVRTGVMAIDFQVVKPGRIVHVDALHKLTGVKMGEPDLTRDWVLRVLPLRLRCAAGVSAPTDAAHCRHCIEGQSAAISGPRRSCV